MLLLISFIKFDNLWMLFLLVFALSIMVLIMEPFSFAHCSVRVSLSLWLSSSFSVLTPNKVLSATPINGNNDLLDLFIKVMPFILLCFLQSTFELILWDLL